MVPMTPRLVATVSVNESLCRTPGAAKPGPIQPSPILWCNRGLDHSLRDQLLIACLGGLGSLVLTRRAQLRDDTPPVRHEDPFPTLGTA